MKTILIVDDEAAARYGLRRALESRYRIAEAESAAAARDAIATEKPDLMLLDVVMPGQDGLSYWVRRGDLLVVFVHTAWYGLGGEGHVETEWLRRVLHRIPPPIRL